MSRGRKVALLVISTLRIVAFLLHLLFLLLGFRFRSRSRYRRFYLATRRSGLDRDTAKAFSKKYRKQNIISLRKYLHMLFKYR